ncbi:hypothetical protein [Lysinibacillus sp. fls2-241-R2A-57]|uniref:hypothetical protein n=1 Tax=Lysinibacillus sp. fls2-241-R2A-57 TaxID=3040292 RepID=UPI0025544359|nr:hypothetical protein [Lysinibacillus sp. fls2-241-R2A-57]
MSEDIYLVKRIIGRPQEALLCAKAKRQRQMFYVAKAKRQLQSAQPERKSTPHFAKEPCFNGIVFL